MPVRRGLKWLFGWHSSSMVYGSNPVDYIFFFTKDDTSSLNKIFHHDSSSFCQESRNSIHDWWYYTIGIIQYHNVFKKRIAQWLAYWYCKRSMVRAPSRTLYAWLKKISLFKVGLSTVTFRKMCRFCLFNSVGAQHTFSWKVLYVLSTYKRRSHVQS